MRRKEGRPWISEFSFGGHKHRGREIAIYMIKEISQHEMATGENRGHKLMLKKMDVKGAFPGAFREGADWKMRRMGVTGKIWRMQRLVDEGSYGEIRVNGRSMGRRKNESGLSQGSVSAPRKYKWLHHDMPDRIGRGMGEKVMKVGGKPFMGVIYVDDAFHIIRKKDERDWRAEIVKDERKWRYDMEEEKEGSLEIGSKDTETTVKMLGEELGEDGKG
jgi:hypothetical protein